MAITREDVDRTLSYSTTYSLVDSDDNPIEDSSIQRETEEVTVTLNVLSTKEVPLDVTIIDGGGATSKDTKIEIDPPTITLSGDATVLDGINKITLGTIDLADIEASTRTIPFDIVIPNDTKNVSGVDQANVTVTIRNKATAVIRATNITFIHVPEGLEPTSVTKQVQVTIRAATSEIQKITANNIRVVADLADFSLPGTNTVPVTIYIDGYPDAGYIGDYTIVVSLAEKTDDKG